MIIKTLAILIAIIQVTSTQQIVTEFQIRKRHPKWSNYVLVGKLTVTIFNKHQIVESEVEPYQNEFLTQQDFQDDNPIIMEFVSVKSNSQDYKDKVYMTSIDEINTQKHGQKISIITGLDQNLLNINSINYVQTRNNVGTIFTEVLYTKEEEHQIFKFTAAPKSNEQTQETFFSKYKWPLIIGGVVLYTMMTTDAGKQQGGAPARS